MCRLDLPPPPWIVGHRGAAGEELENTIESIALAAAQGADVIEIDIQMTADEGLAAFHDWTLDRLGHRGECVETARLEELRRLRLATASGDSRRIASLADVLEATPDGVPLNLELKRRTADRRRFAKRLLGAIAGRPRVLISSFDWELLAAVRALHSDLPLAPLAKRNRSALARAGEDLDAASLHAHRRIASAFLMRLARRSRRPVLAFTVNEIPEARRLRELGVSGFFTDFPGRLRRALDESPAEPRS